MMRRQQRLVQRLLQATENMVQGGLSETSRRCGNPNCICQRDPKRLHGPHLYITYRVDGKSRSLYVPPEHSKTARRAQQAWAAFWKIGCSLAALRSEEHTSELQSLRHLVCRLLLEKKKKHHNIQ